MREEAEIGSAEEQPTRNKLAKLNSTVKRQFLNVIGLIILCLFGLFIPKKTHYFFLFCPFHVGAVHFHNFMEKEIILNRIIEHKKEIESFGAYKIGLFCSYSQDNQITSSDIDLLVHINVQEKTYDNFISLALFLEDLLGKPIDLITPESISKEFYNYIKNNIIYAY